MYYDEWEDEQYESMDPAEARPFGDAITWEENRVAEDISLERQQEEEMESRHKLPEQEGVRQHLSNAMQMLLAVESGVLDPKETIRDVVRRVTLALVNVDAAQENLASWHRGDITPVATLDKIEELLI